MSPVENNQVGCIAFNFIVLDNASSLMNGVKYGHRLQLVRPLLGVTRHLYSNSAGSPLNKMSMDILEPLTETKNANHAVHSCHWTLSGLKHS